MFTIDFVNPLKKTFFQNTLNKLFGNKKRPHVSDILIPNSRAFTEQSYSIFPKSEGSADVVNFISHGEKPCRSSLSGMIVFLSSETRANIFGLAPQKEPFNALTGYYRMILERQRVSEPKKELSEDETEALSEKLKSLRRHDLVSVTYYDKDAYITKTGLIADIDFTSDNECKVLVVFFNRLKQNGKKTFLMFLDIIENGGR